VCVSWHVDLAKAAGKLNRVEEVWILKNLEYNELFLDFGLWHFGGFATHKWCIFMWFMSLKRSCKQVCEKVEDEKVVKNE
jgi:hypothetical protein